MLLDFDGTLGEIQPNPALTKIDADAKRYLDTLATHRNVFVAVISGRRVNDVRHRVDIDSFTYSGNHGMEIAFANGTEYHYPIGAEVYRNCTALKAILLDEVTELEHRKNIIFDTYYTCLFYAPFSLDFYPDFMDGLCLQFEKGEWGGWIEDKNISLVYHYGDVPADLQKHAIEAVSKEIIKYGFRPVQSHSAIEIKPPVVWSKG